MNTVLTVCQPFAHMVVFGPKRVENRTWPTNYRGRLYIHSGKSTAWLERACRIDWPAVFGVPMPPRADLTFGCILGHVELTDCLPLADAEPSPWASGPWCWMLSDPVALPNPVPCKGRQGLWHVDAFPEIICRR